MDDDRQWQAFRLPQHYPGYVSDDQRPALLGKLNLQGHTLGPLAGGHLGPPESNGAAPRRNQEPEGSRRDSRPELEDSVFVGIPEGHRSGGSQGI